jgi:hypothetical protein
VLTLSFCESHRCNGEWFDVPPEMAVAAIAGAAHKLGHPMLPVTVDTADQILSIAGGGQTSSNQFVKPRDLIMSTIVVGVWCWIIYSFVFAS